MTNCCTWDRRKLLLGQFVRPQLKVACAGTATVISLPQLRTMHTSLPQSSLAAHRLSSAHLPCLRPKAPSRTQFCFRMLLPTTDWPFYHRRLDVLFTNSRKGGSTPQVRHPPVRLPLISTLTCSACLSNSLLLRICLWVSQSPQRIAAGWTSLQSWPVSYVVCPTPCPNTSQLPCSRLFHPPFCRPCYSHGQSRLITCLCLLCHFGFSF
jgi:hypothetical protein